MRLIEVNAQENNLWILNPSVRELNAMYQSWVGSVGISRLTEHGRVRRKGQLKWSSVVTLLRTRMVEDEIN